MPPTHRVYLLDPQRLKPETIAVAFAKTSRSPLSFDQIAAELSDEKSARFHEKWVVGYGHASVAEHAVVHIAMENISRLAIEEVESNRLASYTEKSSRYQTWDPQAFYVPSELEGSRLGGLYRETVTRLFDAYQTCLEATQAYLARSEAQAAGSSVGSAQGKSGNLALDACRFLLPAASLANVGVTINARGLEHAICKMLSHPLAEVRTLGKETLAAARPVLPTLLKYAEASPYLSALSVTLEEEAKRVPDLQKVPTASAVEDWCRCLHADADGELLALVAALFPHTTLPPDALLAQLRLLPREELQRLTSALVNGLGEHEAPARALEQCNMTFQLVIDQGAYYELKRHRMATLVAGGLTPDEGYAVPRLIVASGMEGVYEQAMGAAASAYAEIAGFDPRIASYLVPNGFRRSVLLSMNLREAFHLIRQRSAPNAHFSMRRLALRLDEEIRRIAPLFGPSILPEPHEGWREVEAEYFAPA
jgi:thymidylate synthase ThyX